MEARGLWAKMLSEGYRWAEVSSFHFWLQNSERQYWSAWQPTAVFSRQWNWTFGAGETVTRDMKVFNSTRHSDPITVTWEWTVNGQEIQKETKVFNVAPGEAEAFNISTTLPLLKPARRRIYRNRQPQRRRGIPRSQTDSCFGATGASGTRYQKRHTGCI